MDTQITTKFRIYSSAIEIFEAIVDPKRIGNFWFSSSSHRWEQGKQITLRYDEYGAEGIINVLEVDLNKKIVFAWGAEHDNETIVTITINELEKMNTIVEIKESGFKAEDPDIVDKMIGQKEGWVYMLSCLKCYIENDVKNLRASLLH
ncbi:SRPBCC family protein [Cytobacillus praedii]|uniref:SRPBCC family protein n=1 Tax=Cytobacillus praedii TaxID=1742358 RepID=UPI002E1B7BCE|nr:SRPBCC family protein [Cytobacillus praedii]